MSAENQSQEPAPSVLRPHPSHKLLGGALLILVILWAAYGSGDIRIFIDQNSMIFVLGVTFTGLWMCFGPLAVIHAIKHALLDGKTASSAQLSRDITVMGRAYQLAWASGLGGFLLGMVIMLSNLDDPAAIGPGMAVALLTTIYGLILAELLFSPMQQMLMSHLSASPSGEGSQVTAQRSMLSYGVTIVAMAGVILMILIVSLGF